VDRGRGLTLVFHVEVLGVVFAGGKAPLVDLVAFMVVSGIHLPLVGLPTLPILLRLSSLGKSSTHITNSLQGTVQADQNRILGWIVGTVLP
jgi:hypothetical protein